jgi:hypothetical protein
MALIPLHSLGLQAITALPLFYTLSVHRCTCARLDSSSSIVTSWQQIYQCNLKSHVKSSWSRLIPFLPFLQPPISRLLSTTVVYSSVLHLLLLLLLSWRILLITTENTCHMSVDGVDYIENTTSSIAAKACYYVVA